MLLHLHNYIREASTFLATALGQTMAEERLATLSFVKERDQPRLPPLT